MRYVDEGEFDIVVPLKREKVHSWGGVINLFPEVWKFLNL